MRMAQSRCSRSYGARNRPDRPEFAYFLLTSAALALTPE
jgi:hypothetical protein